MTDDLKKRFRDHNVFDYADWDAVIDRIEELEAALSHYACGCKKDYCTPEKSRYRDLKCGWPARQALEKKDDKGEKRND